MIAYIQSKRLASGSTTLYAALLSVSFLATGWLSAQNVGIGIATPAARLEVYDHSGTDVNVGGRVRISADGAPGRMTYLEFAPWRGRAGGPAASIRGIDDGACSAHLTFWTAPPGCPGNPAAVEHMRITVNGNVGIGTVAPAARLHVTGGDARIVCGPGAYGGDAITYGGYIRGWSVSDGHQLLPNPGDGGSTFGWGYIGLYDDMDWWYVYADNYVNTSRRERKRSITVVGDELLGRVMQDIRRMNLYFYKYKGDLDQWIPGWEHRYRANMHIGTMVDEAPDYVKDNAFSGIDLYSFAALGVAGVKYLDREVSQLKSALAQSLVAGRGTAQAGITSISFPHPFPSNGETPIVTLTPTSPAGSYYISHVDIRGFTIVAEKSFSFMWQAVLPSKSFIGTETSPTAVSPSLEAQLQVDDATKEHIQSFFRQQAEKMRQQYREWLARTEKENPEFYQQIQSENMRAREFIRMAESQP